MSFEGYTEYLCKNGHYWSKDALGDEDAGNCSRCKEPPVWSHLVDETNGIEHDEKGNVIPSTVPYPLEVERYEEVLVRVPVYRVPAQEQVIEDPED